MSRDQDRLEPLPDGFTAFHAKDGTRWRHRDVEGSRVGPGYRLFVSDAGERRRYAFGAHEPHDVTLFDLRDQLARAAPEAPGAVDAEGAGESRAP